MPHKTNHDPIRCLSLLVASLDCRDFMPRNFNRCRIHLTLLICLPAFANLNPAAAQSAEATGLPVKIKLIAPNEADSIASVAKSSPEPDSAAKHFAVDLEYRPRMEYRDGYRQLPDDSTHAAYFGSQRSRLIFSYTQPRFRFQTSIQDIRVWGQSGQVSTGGSLQVFEAYADAWFTKNLFIRLGRQGLELDNGRLFSVANWSQPAKAHDGMNLILRRARMSSEWMFFFNQLSERTFDTHYTPATFSNYKLLNIHFLKLKLLDRLTLTSINSADGHESKMSPHTLYVRGTSGGRLEFENGGFYATISGYYQYGQLQSGQQISAYYLQPELKLKFKKFTTRLGAESLSGDDASRPSVFSKSFVPLYGVAWRFMGNMDYFTSFPADSKGGGLINPYLFLIYQVNTRISVRLDAHTFHLQSKVFDAAAHAIDPYLGFENDLSMKYVINNFTTLDCGFSYLQAAESMETLKGGNSARTAVWGYLMVTFKPNLFSSIS